jgi:hypothetical protein
MADKSSFTPDEWKLLLESVMMASIAITAAEPHGLWGLLQESFAGGAELAKAKMDPGADALIKAVVADFGTADGRSVARDGLKEKLTGSKPTEIKATCIETLRQVGEVLDAKAWTGVEWAVLKAISKTAIAANETTIHPHQEWPFVSPSTL